MCTDQHEILMKVNNKFPRGTIKIFLESWFSGDEYKLLVGLEALFYIFGIRTNWNIVPLFLYCTNMKMYGL